MIPLSVLQGDLASFRNAALNWLLENHLYFATLAESTINFAYLLVFFNLDLFANEELKVGLLVEQIFHDDWVTINDAIDGTFLWFLFVEFYWNIFLVEDSLDSSKECNAACLLVIVNIWLVANNFEPNICVELFFHSDNCEYLGSFCLFCLFYHIFIHLIDGQVGLVQINLFLLGKEQSQFTLNSLMTRHDIEPHFIFDRSFVKSNQV